MSNNFITRIPITPEQVDQVAQALWYDAPYRVTIQWEDAEPGRRETYEHQAMIMLEAAFPEDPAELRKIAKRCLRAAEIFE